MRECPTCKRCYPDEVVRCPNDNEATTYSIAGEPLLDGRYQLEKRLGQGGMGVVYKATHRYLRTAHAIKVILPDLVGNDPQLVTRFRQEALAAAAIRHLNIVNVTDYGVANATMPFLVMEFVEGEALHDLLTREKRLSPEMALEIMSGICAGVGAAHKQGIVHRDLKPLNVMLQGNQPTAEAVKVLDFGLAKIKSGELLGSFIAAQTTGLMGSPYYMSPEQWADEEPDAKADIYSLGVILHQMLTGDVPFKGSSIPAIMKKHLNDPPTSFAEMGVHLPMEIENVVRHALEKDRAVRTQTVEEIVSELRDAILSTSSVPHTTAAAIPTTGTPSHQISSGNLSGSIRAFTTLRILTTPTEADVFLNGSMVGKSEANGWFVLEGLQRGSYLLRVVKNGFQAWENEVTFNDEAHQIIVQLKSAYATNVINLTDLGLGTVTGEQKQTGGNTGKVGESTSNFPKTFVPEGQVTQVTPRDETLTPPAVPQTEPRPALPYPQTREEIPRKSYLLPLALGGIFGLLLLSGIGFGIYTIAFQPATDPTTPNANIIKQVPTPVASPATSPVVPANTVAEMAQIPGGSFKMGRNDGADFEKPAHEVAVGSFAMDKTEVTNSEYLQFVTDAKYVPPQNWNLGKPISGQENFPVTNVSETDALAFAEWRSKRDGVTYRLPTEAEWEYAARNGADNALYPWGNKWEDGVAVLNQPSLVAVGAVKGGENKWGVKDLIGNAWEWTSTPIDLYPNNPRGQDVDRTRLAGKLVIRGGSFQQKPTGADAITATYRTGTEPDKKVPALGFRLVRSK